MWCFRILYTKTSRNRCAVLFFVYLLVLFGVIVIVLYITKSLAIENPEYKWIKKDSRFESESFSQAFIRAAETFKTEANPSKITLESREKEYRRIVAHVEMGIPYVYVEPGENYIPKERIVHLDLKGGPPLIKYVKRLLPILKAIGSTAILIEYEDMFPYSGVLSDIRARNAYSVKEVQEMVAMAQMVDLKVIPLVQTFGHLEFALKRRKLSHLRENEQSPSSICPNKNETMQFIEIMLKQVMELHEHYSTVIHIGCDEVLHLGECNTCSKIIGDNLYGREQIFLDHVSAVVGIVRKHWPKMRVLMWDDMLRYMPIQILTTFKAAKDVEPVVWVYTEDIHRFASAEVFIKYSQVFKQIWAASAFKGAFGETLMIPDARRHLENNLQWLKTMGYEESVSRKDLFAGIVLTGWSRYDHFAVLCELLPAALPSLVLSMLTVTNGKFEKRLLTNMSDVLGCPTYRQNTNSNDYKSELHLSLDTDPTMLSTLNSCIFPGSGFFNLISLFQSARTEAMDFIRTLTYDRGWLTEYNRRHNFSSPDRIRELTGGPNGDSLRVLNTLADVSKRVYKELDGVLKKDTAPEFVEVHAISTIAQMQSILNDAKSMAAVKYWERRPLKITKNFLRYENNAVKKLAKDLT